MLGQVRGWGLGVKIVVRVADRLRAWEGNAADTVERIRAAGCSSGRVNHLCPKANRVVCIVNRIDEGGAVPVFDAAEAIQVVREVLRYQISRVSALGQVRRAVVLVGRDAPERISAGAGPVEGVRRTIERRVANPLSRRILAGEFKEGDTALVFSLRPQTKS